MLTSGNEHQQKPEVDAQDEVSDSKSAVNQSPSTDSTKLPPPGTTLLGGSGFEVIKTIGTGTYSKVKLAYSEQQKAMVAIKVILKYHVSEEFSQKFLYNEIKVVKHLKHDNIIQYYQSIESSQRLYVVMQYAENGSILDLIHKEHRLSEQRAAHFFRQILAAVDYCHSKGICHRDIKCENILLDKNNVVKLIDFGFAKRYNVRDGSMNGVVDGASTSSSRGGFFSLIRKEKDLNLSETYCGSFAYASPEILRGIPYHPMFSDLWACGVVLFSMVCGKLPFDDRNPRKLIKQVQSPVVFSEKVKTSQEFKNCVNKILCPLKTRYNIEKLKNDFWVNNAHLIPPIVSTTSSRQLSTR